MASALRDMTTAYKTVGNTEAALNSCLTLIRVLESFKSEPQFLNPLWNAYLDLAKIQLDTDNTEHALASMSEAFRAATSATMRGGNTIFNALSFDPPIRSGEGTDLDWFIKDISSRRFNTLSGDQEYKSLVNNAREMVEKLKS